MTLPIIHGLSYLYKELYSNREQIPKPDRYGIYARLENNLDMAVPKDAQDASQVFSGLACGSLECNYGVASSNTTPEAGRTLVTE